MTTPHLEPILAEEIRALLGPLREMLLRHQAQLDEHRTPDREVIEDRYPQYEEVRLTTAVEASDALDLVVNRLERLVAAHPQRTFTLAFTGPGHEDGASPWLFAVHGTDLAGAHDALTRLPSFRQWVVDTRGPDDPPDPTGHVAFVPEQSYAGTAAPGTFHDLRHEQSWCPPSSTPSRPAPGPPPSRPSGPSRGTGR
ncbi:hypothetical protein [Streptomyces sp. NPDC014894]|uniref:hypothetical protein n=1 Tax=Streptomyces sp. NPDC014894 TaxID=3364931 RepID=UPI0037016E7B